MLNFTTAGESHGKGLVVIIEGVPAGLEITAKDINRELERRKIGYGRGGRMTIEPEKVEIISGIRQGYTIGSPLAVFLPNKDWENWAEVMPVEKKDLPEWIDVKKGGSVKRVKSRVTVPRPGHADLPGAMKYGHGDLRNVLERASARETAARTVAGAVAKKILRVFEIEIVSFVRQVGREKLPDSITFSGLLRKLFSGQPGFFDLPFNKQLAAFRDYLDKRPLRCPLPDIENKMIEEIDLIKSRGDTIGGIIEIVSTPLPPGLGSYSGWMERLDGKIAGALMSIPAIKGVEIGLGFSGVEVPGSKYHDQIAYSDEKGFYYLSNRAGGILGGVTSGQPLCIRAVMKPLPTLTVPLSSVDILTGEKEDAAVERSDTCAISAAGVVSEAMLSFILARAMQEKLGGDHITDWQNNYQNYMRRIKDFPGRDSNDGN